MTLLALLWTLGCGGGEPAATEPAPDDSLQLADAEPEWSDSDRTVLLVSLDGFRWDYAARTDTPNLDRIASEGVVADGLLPVFPTLTFPNHVTQVTGLYPPQHGIVANSFDDPDLIGSFSMSTTQSQWWLGEPIWITAAKQGRKTTTVFWPGSETAYDGIRPHHWLPFDGDMANNDRVDQLLAWLDEGTRPHFGTLYFSDVDKAGHKAGPDAPDVDAAVGKVDAALGRLLTGLDERALTDSIDLIVVSDHGMTQLSRERAIFVDDYTDLAGLDVAHWGPYVTATPRSRTVAEVLTDLADMPHANCTDEASRPADLHYAGSTRIPPILCIAESGWGFTSRSHFDGTPDNLTGGTHGFAGTDAEMRGIFYARGPHFKKGASHPDVHAIDLYALLATLLEVEPAENAGSAAATAGMLAE